MLSRLCAGLTGGAVSPPKMKHVQGPINSKALSGYVQKDKEYGKALDLVRLKLFKRDKRAYTGIAYWSHAATVGSLLIEVQAPASAMLASALEEVLALDRMQEATIVELFGAEALANVKALTPPKFLNGDINYEGYGKQLAEAGSFIKTVKAASLLDHVASVPRKKLGEAFKLVEQAEQMLPHLEGANAEILRRLAVAVRMARG